MGKIKSVNFIKNALLLPLLVASTAAFSQQSAPAEKAQRQTLWMQQNLALTDVQAKKIYTITLHFAQVADTATTSGQRAASRTKDADIRAVLTPAQYHEYHARIQEMQEKTQ